MGGTWLLKAVSSFMFLAFSDHLQNIHTNIQFKSYCINLYGTTLWYQFGYSRAIANAWRYSLAMPNTLLVLFIWTGFTIFS